MTNRCIGRHKRSCNCCQHNCTKIPQMPENPMLANAYIPYQYFDELYCPENSLMYGTTFPELVSPYVPNQSQHLIQYLQTTHTCEEVGNDD